MKNNVRKRIGQCQKDITTLSEMNKEAEQGQGKWKLFGKK